MYTLHCGVCDELLAVDGSQVAAAVEMATFVAAHAAHDLLAIEVRISSSEPMTIRRGGGRG